MIRTHDKYGYQIVLLDNGMTYNWTKKTPLKVGDRVRIPGPMWTTPEQGTVAQLGSEYDGPLTSLGSRVLS